MSEIEFRNKAEDKLQAENERLQERFQICFSNLECLLSLVDNFIENHPEDISRICNKCSFLIGTCGEQMKFCVDDIKQALENEE